MIIPTSVIEQSRNVRWAFLQRACKLAVSLTTIKACPHLFDDDVLADYQNRVEGIKLRWGLEYAFAKLRGWTMIETVVGGCHVE